MKIAVYAVARNEEKNVNQWFDSSKDADFHLILDTGSTDNTVSIAKNLGIVVHEAFFSPWDESMAKNVAMSLLPKDIDLCICLDLDQIIYTKDWKNILTKTLHNKNYVHIQHDFIDDIDFVNKKLNSAVATNIHSRKNCSWHQYRPTLTSIVEDNSSSTCYVPIAISHTPGNEERYIDREFVYLNSWEVEYQKTLSLLKKHKKERIIRYLLEIVANQAFTFFEVDNFNDFLKKEKEYKKLRKTHVEYLSEQEDVGVDISIINTFDSQFVFANSLLYPQKAEILLNSVEKTSLYYLNAQLKLDVINCWKNNVCSENINTLTEFGKISIYADSKTGRHKVDLAKKAYKYFTRKDYSSETK